ncbi:MAG: hypothetical protein JXA77_16280 [Bacteroidales bacterium]|nr:hypothetical protein [Bacteroidales bacterium]
MASQLLDFSKYETPNSKFIAELAENGGHVNFSNSGKGGDKKYFTLSLHSFLSCLVDIKSNLREFKGHENYVEKEWRDLGSEYYTDQPANAQCTVQTKPMFSTLSKIIMWANSPNLDKIDPESTINLEEQSLINAINKVKELISEYTPKTSQSPTIEAIEYSNKSIRDFALYVFDFFYGKDWNEVIDNSSEKDSNINNIKFKSLDFESFSRLIAKFDSKQTKESLTSSNTIRYFDKEILIDGSNFYYFTTQWNGKGEYNLSFNNLKNYFEDKFPNYRLKNRDGKYVLIKLEESKIESFNPINFQKILEESGLLFQEKLITRFISSLITKPFVILSGLSGSGKTKLAQAFAQWICQDDSQYCIVPVGADWTNREPLLGYPNALKPDEYIKPDNGALDVIIQANKHPELPYFLILDEMNLSHVERYFADFLSVMESKGEISLFAEGTVNNGVPSKLLLPSNLFIIGTVNIDETTYMFSPKVLDRANAIEFRVTKNEIENFFANRKEVNMDMLKTQGASMAQSFMKMAERREFVEQDLAETHKTLVSFFEQLKKTGAEFGYRSASEIIRLINQLTVIDADLQSDEKLDIAIMQKLLPKLHGSRRKLCPVLITLGSFCVDNAKIENIEKGVFLAEDFDFESDGVIFPISLEKITRMYKGAIENGFASYAEA